MLKSLHSVELQIFLPTRTHEEPPKFALYGMLMPVVKETNTGG